jgi:hypothetical protein
MLDLSKIWIDFVKKDQKLLRSGLEDQIIKDRVDWDLIPVDLKQILRFNNGQDLKNEGIFKKLNNGRISESYNYLDIDSIFRYLDIIKNLKVTFPVDSDIPFAVKDFQDVGGYGFSINRFNNTINYISFREYDYNGGIVHDKGINKYAENMYDFIENQIMIRQFK